MDLGGNEGGGAGASCIANLMKVKIVVGWW